MFKDLKEGQTNYCPHETNDISGICDECLSVEVNKRYSENNCVKCGKEIYLYSSWLNSKNFLCHNKECPNYFLLQAGI